MIAILGGGVSGLIAAINLEQADQECILIEKNDFLGGRVYSEVVDGHKLDAGFQVLLTAYPYARKYLDYDALKLKTFQPGAIIFKNGKQTKIGDPLRDIFHLFPTLFSWAGTLNDKLKIYELSKKLGEKTIDTIFETEEQTTLSYLKGEGFSDKIIQHFFKPFFGGIFLESNLETSSRMFEFVFKMFAKGHAAIPQNGIEEIPRQLRSQLKKTKIVLNTEAKILEDGKVSIGNEEVEVKGIITAHANNEVSWNGCSTSYYVVKKRITKGNIIALSADEESIINSFHYVKDNLLSVTVIDTDDHDNIDLKIKEELAKLGIKDAALIKRFSIPKSLPVLENLSHKGQTPVTDKGGVPIVEAGDHLYYGSLNAAMMSGEIAATQLLKALE